MRKTRTITIRIEEDVAVLLQRACEEMGIDRSTLVRKALLFYLNMYQERFSHELREKIFEVVFRYAYAF